MEKQQKGQTGGKKVILSGLKTHMDGDPAHLKRVEYMDTGRLCTYVMGTGSGKRERGVPLCAKT